MTLKEYRDEMWDLSLTCNMNALYHQTKAGYWTWCDRGFRFAVGIMAVMSLVCTFVNKPGWLLTAEIVAVFSIIAAVLVNITLTADWASQHRALFERWMDLKQWVDEANIAARLLGRDENIEVSMGLVGDYQSIVARQTHLESSEPLRSRRLLEQCQAEVWQSVAGKPLSWPSHGADATRAAVAVA